MVLWLLNGSRMGRMGVGRYDCATDQIGMREAKVVKKDEVIAELLEEHVQLKKSRWGTLAETWLFIYRFPREQETGSFD